MCSSDLSAGGTAKGRRRKVSSASYTMPTVGFQSSGLSMGEVVGTGSHYAKTGSSFTNPSSAGGDPVVRGSGSSVGPSNSYTITVSPHFQISSNMSSPTDFKKLARDVADMLEQEVKLTMMRMS